MPLTGIFLFLIADIISVIYAVDGYPEDCPHVISPLMVHMYYAVLVYILFCNYVFFFLSLNECYLGI